MKSEPLVAKLSLVRSNNPRSAELPVVCAFPGGPGLSSETLVGIECVADEFDLVLVDPPGLWESQHPIEISYEEVLAGFETELKKLVRPLVLVGHSFGGLYTAELALRKNIDIRGVVLLSAILSEASVEELERSYLKGNTEALSAAEKRYLTDPKDETFKAWLASYGRLFFGSQTLEKGREMLLKSRVSYESFRALRNELPPGPTFEDQFASLRMPKVFLAGAEDELVQPSSILRDARRFGGRFLEIEGAAHFMTLDRPGSVARAVSEFIRNDVLEEEKYETSDPDYNHHPNSKRYWPERLCDADAQSSGGTVST